MSNRIEECGRFYYRGGVEVFLQRLEGQNEWTGYLNHGYVNVAASRARTALAAFRLLQRMGLRGERRLTGRHVPAVLPGDVPLRRGRRVVLGWKTKGKEGSR
jgi:hypothetical protein